MKASKRLTDAVKKNQQIALILIENIKKVERPKHDDAAWRLTTL